MRTFDILLSKNNFMGKIYLFLRSPFDGCSPVKLSALQTLTKIFSEIQLVHCFWDVFSGRFYCNILPLKSNLLYILSLHNPENVFFQLVFFCSYTSKKVENPGYFSSLKECSGQYSVLIQIHIVKGNEKIYNIYLKTLF